MEQSICMGKNVNFENLIFEGGGVKGIAYAGALEVLEAQGILSAARNVAGTSAGAITATLVALNFSAKEINLLMKGLLLKVFGNFELIH